MERNRDGGHQRKTVGMVWANREELLVYGDDRLIEKIVSHDRRGIGVVCALDSQRGHLSSS